MKAVRQVAKLVSAVTALVSWFALAFVWRHFAETLPRTSDVAIGRMYPLNEHGTIVFLTGGEWNLVYGLMGTGVFFFVLTALIYLDQKGRGEAWPTKK